MKSRNTVFIVIKKLLYLTAFASIISCSSNTPKNSLVLADSGHLAAVKQNDAYKKSEAWQILSAQLTHDLTMKPLSVTLSKPLLPNGNAHDYYSVGPYWWPNPSTPDGLPWQKRDGERNYQFRGEFSDNKMFFKLASATSRLALGYHFTADSKYAKKLQQLVEHWFLTPETAMTPHLEFGQGVPGVANGRPYGIIEFRHLLMILDAVTLAKEETGVEFNQAFELWVSDFLNWLTSSAIGTEQATKHNNHGTYYDALVAGMHLFLGQEDQAKAVFETSKKRITQQIDLEGKQAHELERTRPYHYSAFNLLAFTQIAQMAERVGEDLWHFPSKSDPRIMKAFNYLLDNVDQPELWQGKSEAKVNLRHMVVPALRINRFKPVDFDAILRYPSSHQEFTMCKLLFESKPMIERHQQDITPSETTALNLFACTL